MGVVSSYHVDLLKAYAKKRGLSLIETKRGDFAVRDDGDYAIRIDPDASVRTRVFVASDGGYSGRGSTPAMALKELRRRQES